METRRQERMRLVVIGAILLALVPGCGAYFNTFYHAKSHYSRAQGIQKKAREAQTTAPGQSAGDGDRQADEAYRKCIEKCKKVLEEFPNSKYVDDAQLLMAKASFGRGDHLGAGRELDAFVSRYPRSNLLPEALYYQGLNSFVQEDYGDARVVWKQLIDQSPSYKRREVDYYLAQAYWKEDRIDEARETYKQFLERHGGSDQAIAARLDLARMLTEDGEFEEAESMSRAVVERAPDREDRLKAWLLLGEIYAEQDRDEESLELYRDVALDLDPGVMSGRLTRQEREALWAEEKAAVEAAQMDSVLAPSPTSSGSKVTITPLAQVADRSSSVSPQRTQLPPKDPRYAQLARVLIEEGNVLVRLERPWDAINVYSQVIAEYPRTPFAAEAQFRIGYAHEAILEDFDTAQREYGKVAGHARTSVFAEDATRRSRNLGTIKNLMGSASDSVSVARSGAAEARFLRAELYLFQQEKVERAMAEYQEIESDFAGTEYAAKAALAQAWILENALEDTAASRSRYEAVAERYPTTEYGRQARRRLEGPGADPQPEDFLGPSLAELLDPENLASIAAADTTGLEIREAPGLPDAVEGGDLAAATPRRRTPVPGDPRSRPNRGVPGGIPDGIVAIPDDDDSAPGGDDDGPGSGDLSAAGPAPPRLPGSHRLPEPDVAVVPAPDSLGGAERDLRLPEADVAVVPALDAEDPGEEETGLIAAIDEDVPASDPVADIIAWIDVTPMDQVPRTGPNPWAAPFPEGPVASGERVGPGRGRPAPRPGLDPLAVPDDGWTPVLSPARVQEGDR